MIAAQDTNTLLFETCFDQVKLNFLTLSNGPCLGRFSAGELNVV